MPRRCTVCTHLKRSDIDRALVGRGEPFRTIAHRFRVSRDALMRHHDDHLPAELLRAEENRATAAAVDVMGELTRCRERVSLIVEACDQWLRDPDDPTRYEIGPRAEDVSITYWTVGRNGKPVRRKRNLSLILRDVERVASEVEVVEVRHVDPRKLLIAGVEQLRAQLELVSKLVGKLQDGTTVNVFLSAQWQEAQRAILGVLQPHPTLRMQVAEALERAAHASRN